MGKQTSAYVVCAVLQGADTPCSELDEIMAGQPSVRRLNRIERVALAYGGKLVRRSNDGLLVSFNTASDAVFSACEMQRRCADIPSIPGTRFTLQIGIHRAGPEVDLTERPPESEILPETNAVERRKTNRRKSFDTAGQLASIAPDDGIAVSHPILENLGAGIKEISQPVETTVTCIPAHSLDWQNAVAQQFRHFIAEPTTTVAPQKLVLRHGTRRTQLDRLNSVTTIGRDPGCDLVITDIFASRIHAVIEIRVDGCILTDKSSNGTCLTLRSGTEVLLKRESHVLTGRGFLSFGHAANTGQGETFEYQVIDIAENKSELRQGKLVP